MNYNSEDIERMINNLRESLTGCLLTLEQVYGYVVMDQVTLRKLQSSIESARQVLCETDTLK